jgi:hypothetical protein
MEWLNNLAHSLVDEPVKNVQAHGARLALNAGVKPDTKYFNRGRNASGSTSGSVGRSANAGGSGIRARRAKKFETYVDWDPTGRPQGTAAGRKSKKIASNTYSGILDMFKNHDPTREEYIQNKYDKWVESKQPDSDDNFFESMLKPATIHDEWTPRESQASAFKDQIGHEWDLRYGGEKGGLGERALAGTFGQDIHGDQIDKSNLAASLALMFLGGPAAKGALKAGRAGAGNARNWYRGLTHIDDEPKGLLGAAPRIFYQGPASETDDAIEGIVKSFTSKPRSVKVNTGPAARVNTSPRSQT